MATLNPGDTFDVPVTIADNPGLWAMGDIINFNSDAFSLDSVSAGAVLTGKGTVTLGTDQTSGKPKVQFESTSMEENVTGNGTLYTLHFTVKGNAQASEYQISVSSDGDTINLDGQPLNPTYVAGTVTVAVPPAAAGYTVAMSADESSVETGETVYISLDVINGDDPVKTSFNTIDLVLTYDSANFTYDAGSSTLPSDLKASVANGVLTIQKYGENIALADGAEFVLAFKAGDSAAADCSFKLTTYQVDYADHAYADATDATLTGNPVKVSITAPVYYDVTFNANGHGTAPKAQSVKSGEKATNPGTLTADGWTHDGKWYTEAACSNVYDFDTPVTADIELYAKWTENVPKPAVTVETSEYVDGYTLIKATITNPGDNVPTYGGNAMFKVTNVEGETVYEADAYYYVVKTSDYDADNVGYAEMMAETITKDGDANCTDTVDINDAQFVYNLYNDGVTVTYEPSVKQLLASDVNGDGKVDTFDCAAAVGKIG